MRLSEEKIKQAILHPESEVRLTALRYLSESHTEDASVMPLVIQAVERYGLQSSADLLERAARLPQTPETVEWLISQLRRDFDTRDMDADNLRFTLARVLYEADPELLARRHSDILSSPAFPDQLKGPLDERLKLEFTDWPKLWSMFEELGRQTMKQGRIGGADGRRLYRLVTAMARHQDEGAVQVLMLLGRRYKGHDKALMAWLESRIVGLAGLMRLRPAIPLLVDRVDGDLDIDFMIGNALVCIGGQAVVDAIAEAWTMATDNQRLVLSIPLTDIHSDRALEQVLSFLSREVNAELRWALSEAALNQFDPAGIPPARQVLLEDDGTKAGDYWDLRYRLVATATILQEEFPEYGAWHEEAVATNYGFDKIKDRLQPRWLANSFKDDDERPHAARRAAARSATVYQLKITLKEIKPPVWRRVLVPDCTLDDLHEVIQIVVGWENYHLYCFKVGGRQFTRPDMDDGELNMEDASSTTLGMVLRREKDKFVYQYDFGDDWRHEVLVEKVVEPEPGQKYPLCVKGSRACPPEDVGGPWGYAEYLEALADPEHEDHEGVLDWRGEFDPEAFDLKAVNRALRKTFRRREV